MYFHYLAILVPLLVLPSRSHAQVLSSQQATQLLSAINQATYNLSQFQTKLDQFNLNFNHYHKEFPSSKHARMYREKISGHSLAFVYTEIPYPVVLSSFSHTTDSIALLLSLMQKSYLQVFNHAQTLHQHLDSKAYLHEPQLQSTQLHLKHIQASYADFNSNKKRLLYHLNKQASPKAFPPRHHPHRTIRYQSIGLTTLSQQILHAIEGGYLPEVRKNWKKHKALLKRLHEYSHKSLPALSAYLKRQTQFSQGVEQYLEKKQIPTYYTLSARHYYLNEKLIPLYSGTEEQEGLLDLTYTLDKKLSQAQDSPIWLAKETLWFSPHFIEKVEEPEIDVPALTQAPQFVIVLDASSSMQQGAKLKQVKQFLRRMLPLIRDEKCAIMSFSDSPQVLLPMGNYNLAQLNQALDNIEAKGKSQCQAALLQAYTLLEPTLSTPHILLFTDGAFALPESLTSQVEEGAYQGIRCSVLATGTLPPRSQQRLSTFAKISSGRYYHLGNPKTFQYLSTFLGVHPISSLDAD